jgi:hypothetical protein
MFRSPTEGNFIVRIMNVSLTPNDTLGRMLHTFNCTAYEIAEWNFKNLMDLNLLNIGTGASHEALKVGQVSPAKALEYHFSNILKSKYPNFSFSDSDYTLWFPDCYSVKITDAIPGKKFKLWFTDGTQEEIVIGYTGTYHVQIATQRLKKNNVAFHGLGNLNNDHAAWGDMKVTFEYYDKLPSDTFSKIQSIDTSIEIRRFVGPGYGTNIMSTTTNVAASQKNILSDIRREVGMFYWLKVEKRYIQDVWKINGKYCRNNAGTDTIGDQDWNENIIYRLVNQSGSTINYYSGKIDDTKDPMGTPDFKFALNSAEYSDLGGRPEQDTMRYGSSYGRIELRDVDDIQTLRIGNGLIADAAYRVKIKQYTTESQSAVKNKKDTWLKNCKTLQDYLIGYTYNEVSLTSSSFEKNKYYVYDLDADQYVIAQSYSSTAKYYTRTGGSNVIPSLTEIDKKTADINSSYKEYISALTKSLQ